MKGFYMSVVFVCLGMNKLPIQLKTFKNEMQKKKRKEKRFHFFVIAFYKRK